MPTHHQPDDILTAPISLGLRLGQPAIANPTERLPIWSGKPPLAPVAQHRQPRRSVRLWLLDEGVALVGIGAGILGISALIASYIQ